MRALPLLAGVLIANSPLAAQRPATKPTLLVFLTVDQMIPDYFQRYGGEFVGGLKRLTTSGVLYRDGYQDHATTETAPGHAATMSGRFPRSTGIVRNNAGVNDNSKPLLGGGGPGASPFRFQGTTVTDWLVATDPRTRALSISRKDRGAILPIGRSKQAVFWYANDGRFTTSTWYGDTLPSWVTAFNARRIPARAAGSVWTLLKPASTYAEPDSVPIESNGRDFTFPHPLPPDTARAVRAFPEDPRMDELTLQAGLVGLQAMQLGRGPHTDVLALSLSTTDAVGHRFGPDSREIHDQILRLDRYLGQFIDSLYRLRDSTRIIFALTADHGVQPFPELHFRTRPAEPLRVNVEPILTAAMRSVRARGLDTALALDFEYGMLFADSMQFTRAGMSYDSVLTSLAAQFRRVPGVARVDLVRDLRRSRNDADVIGRRWRNALPPQLPVAIVVTPKPFVYWNGVTYATHGSPNDADARVPILFAGPGFARGVVRSRPVRVVDIAPTLARRLGIRPLERIDGVVLTDAFAR